MKAKILSNNMLGLIHVVTGDGKGKTSTSIGITVRMLGNGYKCLFVQFLKTMPTGETKILTTLGADVIRSECSNKFTCDMTNSEILRVKDECSLLLNKIKVISEQYDLLVLDEVFCAISCGFLTDTDLVEFLKNKKKNLEVVLTGRGAPKSIIDMADYVSNICAIKHPMDKRTPPRKGIEF